jgi:tellurite methyltransferase
MRIAPDDDAVGAKARFLLGGAMDERERWNARYTAGVDKEIEAPYPFLREHVALLPRGRGLELAMGEGQNAIFLAEQGYAVTAIDISEVAVERARRSVQLAGIAIEVQRMDLGAATLPTEAYAVVACLYYLQRDLLPQIVNALKPGRMVIYETFTRGQARYGHPTNPAYLLQANQSLEAFGELRVRVDRELLVEGLKAVASLVGAKGWRR